MASTYTASLRFTLQATGEGFNIWGNILNSGCFALIDTAIAGRYSTTSSAVPLSTAQGATDQARSAILDVTGGSGTTFTAPSVSKLYFVRNASSGDTVVTTAGATQTAVVKAGERIPVYCDGTNYYRMRLLDMGGDRLSNLATPTANNDAVTKSYVDGIAFQTTGVLPGQGVGTTYNAVYSDGTNAAWRRSLPLSSASTLGQVLKSTGVDGYPTDTSQWSWDGWQGYQTKSANYTLTISDRAKVTLASNTITISASAAASLGGQYYGRLINVGTGLVTFDPAGAETVTVAGGSAKSSIVLIPGEGVDLFTDASNWIAVVTQSAGAGPHLYAYEDAASSPSYSPTTWQGRPVSNIVDNILGVTYSGGNLTNVPPGKYRAKFSLTGVGVDVFVGRIYNNTAAAEIFHGEAGNSTSFGASTAIGGYAAGDDVFTLSVTSSLALQSYGTNNNGAGTWLYGGASPVNKAAAIWLTRISP